MACSVTSVRITSSSSPYTPELQLSLRVFKAPGCAPLRRARFPAPLRAPLLPSARSARAAPTRAHTWIGPVAMSRSPHRAACSQDDASGGGSAGTGMEGAPFAAAGP